MRRGMVLVMLLAGCGTTSPVLETAAVAAPSTPSSSPAVDPLAVQRFWEHEAAYGEIPPEAWASHLADPVACFEGRPALSRAAAFEHLDGMRDRQTFREVIEVSFERLGPDRVRARTWVYVRPLGSAPRIEPRVVDLERQGAEWRVTAERRFGGDCGEPAGLDQMEPPAAVEACVSEWRRCQETRERAPETPFGAPECPLIPCIRDLLRDGHQASRLSPGSVPFGSSEPGACEPSGFCAVFPTSPLHTVSALAGRAADDLWAASAAGLFHFDGVTWRPVAVADEPGRVLDVTLDADGAPLVLRQLGDDVWSHRAGASEEAAWSSALLPRTRLMPYAGRLTRVGDAVFAHGSRGALMSRSPDGRWQFEPRVTTSDISTLFARGDTVVAVTPRLALERRAETWTRRAVDTDWRCALDDGAGGALLFGQEPEPALVRRTRRVRGAPPRGVMGRVDAAGEITRLAETPVLFHRVARDGDVLFGLGEDALYRREGDGEWTPVPLPRPPLERTEFTDVWAGDGVVFVVHGHGVFRRPSGPGPAPWTQWGAGRVAIQSRLARTREGDIFLLRNRRLFRWAGEGFEPLPQERQRTALRDFAAAPDGALVVLATPEQTDVFDGERWRTVEHPRLDRLWPTDGALLASATHPTPKVHRWTGDGWEETLVLGPEERLHWVDGPRAAIVLDQATEPHRLLAVDGARRRLLRRVGSFSNVRVAWRGGRQVLAVIGNQLVRFDGRRWTETEVQTFDRLPSSGRLVGERPDELWGSGGTAHRVFRFDGAGFVPVRLPFSVGSLIAHGAERWAVLRDGSVWRWRPDASP